MWTKSDNLYLILDLLPLSYQISRERLIYLQKILMNESWSQHQSTEEAINNPDSVKKGWLAEGSAIWQDLDLPRCNLVEHRELDPPWKQDEIQFIIEQTILDKYKYNPDDLEIFFDNILSVNSDEKTVLYFTDGSKFDDKCGAGFVAIPYVDYQKRDMRNCKQISIKLGATTTILQEELYAIQCTLEHFLQFNAQYGFNLIINVDSLGAILNIKNRIIKDNFIILNEISKLIFKLSDNNISIKIVWCPSHVGIIGNELVDEVAKDGANLDGTSIIHPLSFAQFKTLLFKKLVVLWNDSMDIINHTSTNWTRSIVKKFNRR